AVEELKDFIQNYKQKKQKAALLHGPIGTGKTSAVYALINELDYDILEINSSDLRNKDAMGSFLNSAMGQQSLFFKPKVILIDELDNFSGRKDRGGVPELVKALDKASFPVIMTANDPSDSKFKALRQKSLMIEFHKLEYRSIAHALQWVCEQENIGFEEKAINSLARQADGDMRAALIDLQSLAGSGKIEFNRVIELSDRKRTDTIFNALNLIFKSSSVETALPAFDDVDLDTDQVFLWMDENLPKEYKSPIALAKAYEHISRADIFRNRIMRRQHWRFLVYIYNLLSAGVSNSKDQKNSFFVEYRQPMRLLKIWQSNIRLAKKKDIAEKLAIATHTSKKVAVQQVTYLQNIFQHARAGEGNAIAKELDLSDEEADWLRG
ncbi:MAG: replication factor C large subunit, partial [Nanoarchaeota archaeon]|nr:replication factor C large subunit [Nanoarchaeota archaeon]